MHWLLPFFILLTWSRLLSTRSIATWIAEMQWNLMQRLQNKNYLVQLLLQSFLLLATVVFYTTSPSVSWLTSKFRWILYIIGTDYTFLDWKQSKMPKKIFYVLSLWFLQLWPSHAGFTVQSLMPTGWMLLSLLLQCKLMMPRPLYFFLLIYLDLLLLHALMVLHLLMLLQQKVQKERQAACHLLSIQWLHVCCSSFSLLVLLLTFRYVYKSGWCTTTHPFSDFKTAFIKDQLKDAKIITSMVAAAANSVVLFLMGQSTSKECFFNLKLYFLWI